ncbi:hypothetical protein [Marinibactrum halimedae]|uniref:Uncharacterized protein n=1 Tax=Marinibactrum halimedae TaxID=1444977 RepID=A0AA37TAT8_9GAMM|nr:hypothetical protein [Marinibactrum halimedae]MCD9459297.1 hypothetical protein [Marinibactrum halimedae]GLS25812.1 hypothetical protein GCM10007877_15260 [Marinibactrum halimedae]
MEPFSAMMMVLACILLLVSWVQMLWGAFSKDETSGLVTLFLPPLAYLYAFFQLKNERDPDQQRSLREPLVAAGLGCALLMLGLV